MKKEKEIKETENLETIIWKDIPGYPDHQASNMGDIRYRKKIVKSNITINGYKVVNMRTTPGKFKTENVHKLIAITFLNHVPNGHKLHIDHIDWDKTNNRVENLQIITARENAAKDSFRRKSVKTPAGSVFNRRTGKYHSSVHYKYDVINLGQFDTNKEALDAYETAIENLDKWNGNRIEFLKEIGIYKEPELKYSRYRKGTNILKGVYQTKSGNWTTGISLKKKRINLGTYKDKDTAAQIYELAHKYQNVYKGCNKSFVTFLKNRI